MKGHKEIIYNIGGFLLGTAIIALIISCALPMALATSSENGIEMHGNVKELGYIRKEVPDDYGNTITIYIWAFLLPKDGPLNYEYPNNHEASIIYAIEVDQSPAGRDHDNWGLKDGDSSHHTITIEFNNPKSGKKVVDMSSSRIPKTVIKRDYGGTVSYGFGITWGVSKQMKGGKVHLDANGYISWSIPIYQYKFGPSALRLHEFQCVGDVNSGNPFDQDTYFYAREYTMAVSVEYPYLDYSPQSIHIYVKGMFHQWGYFNTGKDSTITWSYTWTVIRNNGEVPI